MPSNVQVRVVVESVTGQTWLLSATRTQVGSNENCKVFSGENLTRDGLLWSLRTGDDLGLSLERGLTALRRNVSCADFFMLGRSVTLEIDLQQRATKTTGCPTGWRTCWA